MAPPPPSDTIDAVPLIVQGAPNNTTQDPNVVVDTTPLVTRVNCYRPSKPTTMVTAVVANQQLMVEGCY
eukprot:scaffold418786_cov35-Attheya_sp.AAC.1